MARILVLGPPGAGKSHLAAELARRLDRPLIHLDREYWRPGWVAPSREAHRARIAELVQRPRWIMDGNYVQASLDLRLARADSAVLLDFPRRLCLWRILKRIRRSHGFTRPDMAPGCPEQLDLGFLRYAWRFHATRMPALRARLAGLEAAGGQVVRLTRPAEAVAWLARQGARRTGRRLGHDPAIMRDAAPLDD